MSTPYHRPATDVEDLDELAFSGLLRSEATARRYDAVVDVLRRLGDAEFETAREAMGSLRWFLPAPGVLGTVRAFPGSLSASDVMGTRQAAKRAEMVYDLEGTEREVRGRFARVVFLSAELEGEDEGTVRGVVARQLAEVVLLHRPLEYGGDPERRRADVERLVEAWL